MHKSVFVTIITAWDFLLIYVLRGNHNLYELLSSVSSACRTRGMVAMCMLFMMNAIVYTLINLVSEGEEDV